MALPYATEDQLKILERKTKSELDKKTANINLTANTLDDMNALIASGSVHDGQLCYLKEDKKLYVLKDNVWSEVGGGGSKVGTIVLDETQSEAFNNRSFSFTEEQLNIIKSNDYIYLTYTIKIDTNSLLNTIFLTKGTSKIEAGGESIMQYALYDIVGGAVSILFFSDDGSVSFYDINSIDTYVISAKITGHELHINYAEPGLRSGYTYSISRINNKLLIGGDGDNFQITEDKPVPLFAKYNVLVPKDSSYTSILPCTASDNGKVLSVVNGEAQWASAGGSGSIPPLLADASTSTYVLKAVNGTIQWVKES